MSSCDASAKEAAHHLCIKPYIYHKPYIHHTINHSPSAIHQCHVPSMSTTSHPIHDVFAHTSNHPTIYSTPWLAVRVVPQCKLCSCFAVPLFRWLILTLTRHASNVCSSLPCLSCLCDTVRVLEASKRCLGWLAGQIVIPVYGYFVSGWPYV